MGWGPAFGLASVLSGSGLFYSAGRSNMARSQSEKVNNFFEPVFFNFRNQSLTANFALCVDSGGVEKLLHRLGSDRVVAGGYIISLNKALNILVAEDDELVGELLAEILHLMGHRVCAIETSEAGTVMVARQFQPDLLIVDFRLNPGCGVSAVDSVLKTGFIPHILMSGSIAELRERKPDAILLAKPYSPGSLASAIHRACEFE